MAIGVTTQSLIVFTTNTPNNIYRAIYPTRNTTYHHPSQCPPYGPATRRSNLSPPFQSPRTTTSAYPYPHPPPSSTTGQPIRTRPPNLRPNPKPTKPYNASSYHTQLPSPDTEPATFTIANRYPQWRSAMADEYSALMRNGTWTLVPRVPNSNVIDSKWVYKLKRDQTGAIKRYKARLVAKGFRQQPGIDYQETFSPVVKSTTIRVVLSLAVTHKWSLRQLDVQNAFLHGDLNETVYLQQPPGFVDPAKPDHVCLLHKSLYGLKQAPRAWFHRLSTVLHSLGFQGSKTDPCSFTPTGALFLISQGPDMPLSQKKYILELLQRAGLSNAKPVSSPMTTTANLALGDSATFADPVKYRQIVGALQYVTLSRPDITFGVNKVCQFMHSPTENHWTAVKRILRYLQGTADYGLRLIHDSGTILHAYTDSAYNSLTGFSDADWAGCPDDRRSTGGYAIYLGSNLVSLSARKQRTVSRSSTESEYKALADTVAELTWLQTLLRELQVPVKSVPTLWCDNLGATYLSANPVFHARTKHVEVDFHFVREMVAQRKLSVQFISTDDQIADVFTKPLPSQRFLLLRSKLQVASRP
ncbi:hypothetical protein OSB04_018205 [Centaurea solstitialis]|uniref:Reverse transcriptase Ty1/copia-type domain-containing protein n=1 Tax=Centaurea solstitialis TaxID=347529 RepID=A0AA38T4C6_9ASTR|nr:hypothetical protein OSB04_018205 [Centaurea solstitialis]